jgi:antitoxin (DNA-binding transcriptional repressor) of toxin-antitoxin stability system
MQTLNVRELRNTIPHLRETLAREHELLLVSNGELVARILPINPAPRFESMKWLRDQMKASPVPSEVLIRQERDGRGI